MVSEHWMLKPLALSQWMYFFLSLLRYISFPICSFLAGILAWKDPQVLIPALQIAEIMMEKLPETFSKLFVREGVVHAVESLI